VGQDALWVSGDAPRLAQVISNLVNNAAKYTPPGGQVRVSLRREDDRAVVRVTDNGAGIPAEMLEGVFGMFTQVNRTLHHAQGGLGIGLSLVRRLTELHGGDVVAESAGLEQGSTFIVRLPATDGPDGSGAAPSMPLPRPQRAVRVLVVDDNVDAADTLVDWLRVEGYQPRAEYSGEDALQVVDEFAPEVVFCDLGLPGIDGHEVATRLRADRRHDGTVLVALTGWGSQEDKRRTRGAGFDFHLVKPVRVELVAEILATL
jgi:two-component system, sensor histidine kinase